MWRSATCLGGQVVPGIKPAVAAIVQAVQRIGSKTLKTPTAPVLWAIALLSFVAIAF